MIRLLSAAALATALLGAGAAVAGERCNVPMADWQPREALQQKLAAEGWQVKRIKSDDGCYEVKAVDPQGRRIEAKFDPKSFVVVKHEIED
jgi:hypothetical protein